RRDRSNVAHAFQHVGVAVVVEILHNIVMPCMRLAHKILCYLCEVVVSHVPGTAVANISACGVRIRPIHDVVFDALCSCGRYCSFIIAVESMGACAYGCWRACDWATWVPEGGMCPAVEIEIVKPHWSAYPAILNISHRGVVHAAHAHACHLKIVQDVPGLREQIDHSIRV